MTPLSFQVPDNVADALRLQAQRAGKTLPDYLAGIVTSRVHTGWPEEYVSKVLGGWKGEAPQRPGSAPPEERDSW